MDRVHSAVEAGRCVVAVGSHLLRDAKVLLALRDRSALPAVALSGPAVPPTQALNAESLARATAQANGVIVLVEPEDADRPGLDAIAQIAQASPHKPTIVVVSRAPNALLFTMLFRGLPLQMEKDRGGSFVGKLPVPAEADLPDAPAPVAKAKSRSVADAPRNIFVGRDEELEALKGLLAEGGPIVVSGPEGVGRNTLIDNAIAAGEHVRHPDVLLGRGAGFDMLMARLAEITSMGGSTLLADALANGESTPIALAQAAIQALQAAEGTEGQVMVVQPLEAAAGRELDFFRKDRLGYLTQQLLAHRYPLRLVFIARGQPAAYDHQASAAVRRFEVGGLKGRFYHEIFDAYHAGDVPRDKFGPLSERLHGHAMAVRQAAIEVHSRGEKGIELLDNPKWLKASDLSDTAPLRKLLMKRIEKLQGPEREALQIACHLRLPVNGQVLADLGIARKARLTLLAQGFLETRGTLDDKLYQVHPLVRSCLRFREISDFDLLAHVARMHARLGQNAEGVERIAQVQEANRCLIGARRGRDTIELKYPDNDAELEAVIGMMRSNNPHFQMAQDRLKHILKMTPGNADAHLLKLELMRRVEASREALDEAYDLAIAQAPVPEIFHDAATHHLSRKSRGKAITVLEAAVALLPDEVRLKTRLAALLLRQGRRNEALELLKAAMEAAPMLPDAYGLLGMARFDEGADQVANAEELLREAVRLAPTDPVQVPRLVTVLLARARVADAATAQALRDESKELLSALTRDDNKSPEGFLQLARLELEVGGSAERADWLLKQARKRTDRRHERNLRIRLEQARIDLATGKLDQAEKECRALAEKDPSNPRIFITLAGVLEAREQLIPAHAELLRATERTGAHTLEGQWVASELVRLQKAIEAQGAAIAAGIHVGVTDGDTGAGPAPKPPQALDKAHDHARTKLRKKASDAVDAVVHAAEAVGDAVVEAVTEAVEVVSHEIEALTGAGEADAAAEPEAAEPEAASDDDAPKDDAQA